MKRRSTIFKVGMVGLATAVLPILGAGTAFADYAPQSGDIVGVGGDTPQYALSFLADGDNVGDAGFNNVGAYNRLVSFSATPDANGRSAYTNSVTTGTASVALNPTDVLRAGTSPVQRVSSSGSAITALLADTGSPETINYVSSASLPTAAQQTQAGTNGWGYLHVVEIGTDAVQIAEDLTTNGPSTLDLADLYYIYTAAAPTWNNLPDDPTASTDAIIPYLPPSTSTIEKQLIADLTTYHGSAPTIAADVKTVEQNDPSVITGSTHSADVIVPFSQARFNLWADNYFKNPATPFPGGVAQSSGIKLAGGYSGAITDYVIFRQSDAASTTPFEPGSSKNWVQTLFSGTNPLVAKGSGQALIAASGVTPNYVDLGNVSHG